MWVFFFFFLSRSPWSLKDIFSCSPRILVYNDNDCGDCIDMLLASRYMQWFCGCVRMSVQHLHTWGIVNITAIFDFVDTELQVIVVASCDRHSINDLSLSLTAFVPVFLLFFGLSLGSSSQRSPTGAKPKITLDPYIRLKSDKLDLVSPLVKVII